MKNQNTKLFLSIIFILTTLICLNSNTLIAQNGLVGYFPLDGDGTDLSALSIDGSVINATSSTGPHHPSSTAMYFNGTNSLIYCGTNGRGIDDTVSISAWIRTTSSKIQMFVTKYNPLEDQGFHFNTNDGYLRLGGRDGNGNYLNSGPSSRRINDGKWHHVVARIYGNTWEYWIDCQLDNTFYTNTASPSLACNEPLTIGNYNYENDKFFDGDIDEVRIYNTKISTSLMDSLCQSQALTHNTVIPEPSYTPMTIFPNPSQGIFNIESGNTAVHQAITVNALGQVVSTDYLLNNQFDISHLPSGIYWITLLNIDGAKVGQEKVIKQP